MKKNYLLIAFISSLLLLNTGCSNEVIQEDNLSDFQSRRICNEPSVVKNLEDYFHHINRNNRGMGSISIFQNGNHFYSRSYGYTNINTCMLGNPSTLYRIGSTTKTFTATIIMKLVEQRKITLETKLSQFYPQIQNANQITILDLLTHKSGIPDYFQLPDYRQWYNTTQSKQQMINRIAAMPSLFPPRMATSYSNSNYLLLTYIAESVTAKSYSNLLKQYIVSPLRLERTAIGNKINPRNNEASSYFKTANGWVLSPETNNTVSSGAGFLVSTVKDMNTFFYKLLNGKLVNQESLQKMTEIKQEGDYGIGLMKIPYVIPGKSSGSEVIEGFGHSGVIDGFKSLSFNFAAYNLTITIVSNGTSYDITKIMQDVLAICLNRNFVLPEFKEPIDLTSQDLDKYLGTYMNENLGQIVVSKQDNVLIINFGGDAYSTISYDPDVFVHEATGTEAKFILSENKMILTMGLGSFVFVK